jgi:hypothetical protein
VSVWLWPMVGLNFLLALPFHLLGPLGGWLTAPAGRNVLGFLGLLALAAAGALLALDGFGWTW